MKKCTGHRYFAIPANGHEEPAPQDLQDRIALAFADDQVRSLAQKTAFRIVEISRKAALDHAMLAAVQSADPADGNVGVLAELEKVFSEVSQELAEWNSAAKIAEQRAKERSAQLAPMIRRANNRMIVCENQILRLKMRLNEARRPGGMAPSEKLKAYRSAGLDSAQIEKLGDAGPTPISVEQAEWDIKVIEGELQRLSAFVHSPLHRLSDLQGLKLTAADDHNPGRYVPPVKCQFGKVA